MATEKELIAAGADCVCGDLVLNHVVVGRYRDGSFYPTDEGMSMQVAAPMPEQAPEQAPPPAALKTPRRPKPAPAPAVETPPAAPDPLAELDNLGQ